MPLAWPLGPPTYSGAQGKMPQLAPVGGPGYVYTVTVPQTDL